MAQADFSAGCHSTTNPVPVEDIAHDGRWLSQHNRFLKESQMKAEETNVLFIGDSIIQRLQDSDIWRELLHPLQAVNFGIGGDTTQNLLWRIADGVVDHLDPKVIVVHIGTNNFLNTADEVQEGILEVVRLLHEKKPRARIVLIELFPRGEKPNQQREKHITVNKMLHQALKDHRHVRVVDLDPGFVATDGLIHFHDMHDYLHLTNNAYKKAFEPLYSILVSLIGEVEWEWEIQRRNSVDPHS
ncbi:platelet-activating factor acetylhydrolase IB subunit alpha2-like [Paramacrobiotus metropolitanus]|uniref:platelet-activating factor acetylhydrolase IB subunit alpha2-like n=1 Tax=Paramacrobiotus metropolitanus TaxID=2943436 RepID=UPI00244581EF|nr:platelet-activating factor acetylhydrolase IB subunit alpha2-like [Paramacrobiotus metropolitanus]XP_055338817.1 platelet-activating factor acetylhydrolase IB subunit alpha2-like [Paramacrobiotus metropolitanus]